MDPREQANLSIEEVTELVRKFKKERKYHGEGITELKIVLIYLFSNLPPHLKVITALDLLAIRVEDTEELKPHYIRVGDTLLFNVVGEELADEGIGIFRFVKGTPGQRKDRELKDLGISMNTRIISIDEALNIIREDMGVDGIEPSTTAL